MKDFFRLMGKAFAIVFGSALVGIAFLLSARGALTEDQMKMLQDPAGWEYISITDPDAHLIRAIEQGAFYFIQKPFDRQVLQTLVQRCLELRYLRLQADR